MTPSPRWVRPLAAAGSILLLAGCVRLSSVGSSPVPTSDPSVVPVPSVTVPVPTPSPTPRITLAPTPSPTPAPTPTPDDGAQVVEVSLLDTLVIEPTRITVRSGTPVRFVVTNDGGLPHDFFIGTDREQKQRESAEAEPGPDRYIEVPPGETRTLTMTFPEATRTIAGCVVPGHYSAGMRSTVVVREP
ncbi:MAG: hypothetical protein KF809_10135 [Chloroflexi bacterium]|nr:hypothetical protein [Chloroflexota bacterium]